MGTTEQLAKLLVETNFEDVPKETVERAKDALIDFVGGALVGCQTTLGKLITDYVRKIGAAPEGSVIGAGLKTSAAYAAFANATLDHAPELEALGGPIAYYNPTSAQAACLSVPEMFGFGGREVLESLIVGFEFQGRVSHGCAPNPFMQITSTYLGSAAVAAKAMRLNIDQVRAAISICVSQTSGLPLTQETTRAHYLELSYPCRVGVESAILAREGISANPNIIEDPNGYCEAFIGQGKYDLEDMVSNWGKPFAIGSVALKKYPCCFASHRSVDALMALIQENKLSYDDIVSVEANINEWIAKWIGQHADPHTEDEARFSLQHILASGMVVGKVIPESFTDETVNSEKYKKAREKVKINVHSEWPKGKEGGKAQVDVKLKNGKVLTKTVDYPRSPDRAEVIEAYKDRAQRLMPLRRAEETLDMMLNLEKLDRISDLMNKLALA